jgi:hypothetical protein
MPFPLATFPHRAVGPTLVSWPYSDSPGSSKPLGYADDRIQIEERPFWEDIRNDAFGGAAGIPSDVQFLGSIAIVTCNLNRFTLANIEDLAGIDSVPGTTYGTGPQVGTFMRQETMYGSLILSNKTETLTYTIAFLRQGRRFNVGVRHQIYSLVFECHVNDPCDMVLFAKTAANDPCGASS